ncbi:hypothetical protein bcgnr5372_40940 [Bacillus luti]|nr:hypothetical protein [Bacillus cereus]HDR8327660.1 hypothetical protein [Bacillus cereus]HDR8334369.1 hypothetical protein [Bacillus cereus]
MNKTLIVDREVMFFAFRYALGRQSMAPTIVTENIKANIKEISIGDIHAYIREIDECSDLGMGMDKDHWMEFKKYLEAELQKK